MNRKAQITLGSIVVLIMVIFVSLAFIPQIFDEQSKMTTKTVVNDEVVSVAPAKINGDDFNASVDLTVTNAPSGWKTTGCPLTSVVVSNASGTALTLTTDYTFTTSSGVLNIVNNSDTVDAFTGSNNSLVDYNYCQDGYITGSGGRGVTKLIGLFSTLALLAAVLFAGKIKELFGY